MTEQAAPTPVTVRYWAGARQAAGVAEEAATASTLAELLAAVRDRHDDAFGRVLSVCSFVVGDQPVGLADPTTVVLRPGDVVEVLPPFAGGSAPTTSAAVEVPLARRLQVTGAAVLAGLVLAGAAWWAGEGVVWLVAVLLQVPLVLGWHRGLGVTAAIGGMVVGAVVAVVADVAVWLIDDVSMAPLAVVVGCTFLLGAVQQLARRDDRAGLTASMAATSALGFLVSALAVWPVALRLDHGDALVTVAALAVAAASVARLVPNLTAAAVLAPVLGLLKGLGVAAFISGIGAAEGAAVGVVVALPVLLADLLERRDPRLLRSSAGEPPPAARSGTRWALPAAAVWPYALAAPLAFVTARLIGVGG